MTVDLRDDDGLQGGRPLGRAPRRLRQGLGEPRPAFPAWRHRSGHPETSPATTTTETTGLFHYGLPIPTVQAFASDFAGAFDVAPDLTDAELSLVNRAANAPQRAVLPGRAFPITSGYGYVVPGNPFTRRGFDPKTDVNLDGNGVPDCLDSFTGYNSTFGRASFGIVGGCWNIEADGTYRPVRDGLVAGDFQSFGGDSFGTIRNERDDIVLPAEKATVNLMGNIELNSRASVFGEFRHVSQRTATDGRPNSFWDLLFGAPDNPFLPEFLHDVAAAAGGLAITRRPALLQRPARHRTGDGPPCRRHRRDVVERLGLRAQRQPRPLPAARRANRTGHRGPLLRRDRRGDGPRQRVAGLPRRHPPGPRPRTPPSGFPPTGPATTRSRPAPATACR